MYILYHNNYTSTNNGIVVHGIHSRPGARQLAARLAATQPPRADRRTARASTTQEPPKSTISSSLPLVATVLGPQSSYLHTNHLRFLATSNLKLNFFSKTVSSDLRLVINSVSARTPKRHDSHLPISTDSESPVSAFLTTFNSTVYPDLFPRRIIEFSNKSKCPAKRGSICWRSWSMPSTCSCRCFSLLCTAIWNGMPQKYIYGIYHYYGVGEWLTMW